MKRKNSNPLTPPLTAVIALALVAAVACGAAGPGAQKRGDEKPPRQGPIVPDDYDPRISFFPLVEAVSPAVVNIRATSKARGRSGLFRPENLFEWFFGPGNRGGGPFFGPPAMPEQEQRALGSGFIISADGLVVTNNHVIERADNIEVQLADERSFDAEVVGADERTDVAVLKIHDAAELPTAVWGDSEALKVGDRVVAIGNPFGLHHTVTSGIVSAKERVIGAGPYDDFIQTDASINPGNSGGPLFNLEGEVVGINTAINPQGQGIGFAIPSKLARSVIDSLEKKGKVVRGWLGITFQPLDKDLAEAFGLKHHNGVVVANVTPGSPADKAGLESGDVIVEVAGRTLEHPQHLPSIVAGLTPGKKADIEIIRDGEQKTINVEIGELPASLSGAAAGEQDSSKLGFEVEPLSDALRRRLGAENIEGVVVTAISPESPAANALRTGDIIVSVDKKPVKTAEGFASATESASAGDDLLLHVYRGGNWRYVVLKL